MYPLGNFFSSSLVHTCVRLGGLLHCDLPLHHADRAAHPRTHPARRRHWNPVLSIPRPRTTCRPTGELTEIPLNQLVLIAVDGLHEIKEKQRRGSCRTGPHQVLVSHGSQLELLGLCWVHLLTISRVRGCGDQTWGVTAPHRTVNMSPTTRTKRDTFNLPQIFSVTLFDLKRGTTMS